MTIFLKNATYIDWMTLQFRSATLGVEKGTDGTLEFFEDQDTIYEIKKAGDRVIDCEGKLVTKSFACGHHHAYSALARGMKPPLPSPANFHETLQYIWWKLDRCLDLEMVEASALSTAMACARNGVTFVIDHHSSPLSVEGSLQTIARAFDKIGISHLLCCELSDRDGLESAENGLAETENYLQSGKQGLVGLHASFTVGDQLLEKSVALAAKYGSGIHVHVAEDKCDQAITQESHGKDVINRFSDCGVLGFSKTILAHCLHLSGQEREIVSQSPCYIVENVESNLNNRVGYFEAQGMGQRIMLGTDGMHSDMLRSAKAAYLIGQGTENLTPETVYHRLRKVHDYLSENSFKGDADNNLLVINYDPPTEIHSQNFLGHFIFGINSSQVETVISSGEVIMEQGKLLKVDEREINRFCREMANKLWTKMDKV